MYVIVDDAVKLNDGSSFGNSGCSGYGDLICDSPL